MTEEIASLRRKQGVNCLQRKHKKIACDFFSFLYIVNTVESVARDKGPGIATCVVG